MKIKILLILSAFFVHSLFPPVQLASEFSVNDVFALGNRPATFDSSTKILQSRRRNSDAFVALSTANFGNQFSSNNGFGNCDESNSSYAPDALPCNGVSVTPITFNNTGRTVVSGTNNVEGVVYRYPNVGVAPDGTALDALVTVVSYNNNQDADQTNFTSADVPETEAGFERNLQPNINQETAQFTGADDWIGDITYNIQFVVSGTSTLKRISVAITTIDNDGSNGAVCGASLRESVTYSPAPNQFLLNSPTFQTRVGNTITGPAQNQALIGVDAQYANAALYINVNQFNWTYAFATTTTTTCAAGVASSARYGSLNLDCQVDFTPDFDTVNLSGNVFNDVNGLSGVPANTVDGTGTNAGGLFANLLDTNNFVVATTSVAANGTYNFTGVPTNATYNIQITSTNSSAVAAGNAAPATTLPTGWVNTGENLGAGAGNDGAPNGLLQLTIAVNAADITNANFGIEQRPTANNNTAAIRNNPGGTNRANVPATTFSASDPSPGTVTNIRITAFPTNATSITVGTATYYPNAGAIPGTGTCPTASCAVFPAAGITIPTNGSGNPTQTIQVDPSPTGATTVSISYAAIDNAGVESAATATASVPFTLGLTAADGNIAGTLYFDGTPLRRALVVLTDAASNSKTFTRTDQNGKYLFEDRNVGRTYLVKPLSSKYSFSPATAVVNLNGNAFGQDFNSSTKIYRPKNDFDGDGQSDVAVYRPTDGNWYVLRSSDGQFSAFQFGADTDTPVAADYDGDGRTDYAVFRPSEGNWYVWQSSAQQMRVERFGLATDKLIPADYDGDGKADVAVYRGGVWYIRRSSDGALEAKTYGAETDTPLVGDFDGDGKTDKTVFRPTEGVWFTLRSSDDASFARSFGLATDTPLVGDFDGDGVADIAQYRNGCWFVLNSTTDFEASLFGAGEDRSIVGDYDGDGRADATVFRDGSWSIRNSGDGNVRNLNFGLPTDVLIR